ncbi:MAG TPA: S8 family serine peptidase [Steroidobacteraceae bacterium]|nr:S8 family serine peptidase [Steroidobacteraceae bacterium]
MMTRHRRWIAGRKAQAAIGLAAAALMAAGFASATERPARQAKSLAGAQSAALTSRVQVDSVPGFMAAHTLRQVSGTQTYIARLASPGVAAGGSIGKIGAEQQAFIGRVLAASPSSRVVASVRVVMNAVFIETDRAGVTAMGNDVSVTRVVPVGDYQIDLSETVPYIGAETVHGLGIRGAGVRVAVLDSGADYTHADLGGTGNPADYAANDPTTLADGGFPNSKFIGGTDFVGSHWPFASTCTGSGPLEPDADPLDKQAAGCPDQSGHGTHVASIIAGIQGVAPDAKLYAVKVCSATSTSCSGVALIEGMEFAVDPNGDGDASDHVDIVNMSLGSNYGQPFDDDLSFAVDQATAVGVLTAAAAGNAADKPYIVSTPSAALTAISVAQTAVPSEKLNRMRITDPVVANPDRLAIAQTWSAPLSTTISGVVQYGNGAGANLNGCAPLAAGSATGRIVLVNRGVCAFSIKISNIADGGAALGIIGLIDGSQPFAGSFGGGTPERIPGFMISLVDANAIRGGATVSFDPANVIALAGSLVATSARGPMFQDHRIKPEIGAPGASVSSEHGTGTGRTAFGGTSGATPMIAGSAALLKQFYSIIGETSTPNRLKQTLMDTAETNVLAPSVPGGLVPDVVAPISRIGGGEVRVDRAVLGTTSVNPQDPTSGYTGGLSFGFIDVSKGSVSVTKEVYIKNHSWSPRSFTITPTARYADDVTTGAVSLSGPASVTLGGMQGKTLKFKLTIDGTKLRPNLMNSGSGGNNPAFLTANEYDGYVVFASKEEKVTLPWHVLPRKASSVTTRGSELSLKDTGIGVLNGTMPLKNGGIGPAQSDTYTLLAVSDNLPQGPAGGQSPTPDIHAFGVNTVLDDGCDAGFIWEFAFNDWERQTMSTGVIHEVDLDINRDGVLDYAVFNFDLSLSNSLADGRQVTWAQNLATGAANAFFFAEHSTNTGNIVLRVCGEQVGLTSADILNRNVDIVAGNFDFWFGGPSDVLPDVYTIAPYGEEFYGVADDLAGGASGVLTAFDFGAFPGNTPELGLMVITNGDRLGNHGGSTKDTELLLFARPGGNVHAQ